MLRKQNIDTDLGRSSTSVCTVALVLRQLRVRKHSALKILHSLSNMWRRASRFTTVLLVVLFQAVSAFQITGATDGIDATTGARPFRYEINEFAQHGPAWDLFILALQRFQSTNETDPLSYFQVAGKLFAKPRLVEYVN